MFETKDSGKREQFSTGMQRDTNEGKIRYDLMFLKSIKVPMIQRYAELLTRGAIKYEERNFEKAETQEELDRFKESAIRHFFQWMNNEEDEDHASAIWFNIEGAEMIKQKLKDKLSTDMKIFAITH